MYFKQKNRKSKRNNPWVTPWFDNVCHAEKHTNWSCNILLRLVRFSAWQTLFTAHFGCQKIRSVLKVLGIYNFGQNIDCLFNPALFYEFLCSLIHSYLSLDIKKIKSVLSAVTDLVYPQLETLWKISFLHMLEPLELWQAEVM